MQSADWGMAGRYCFASPFRIPHSTSAEPTHRQPRMSLSEAKTPRPLWPKKAPRQRQFVVQSPGFSVS